jgi:hypothetical protein
MAPPSDPKKDTEVKMVLTKKARRVRVGRLCLPKSTGSGVLKRARAARKRALKGGYNAAAFEGWLETCVFPLFPGCSPTWEYDADGQVTKGPIAIEIDGVLGHLGPESDAWRYKAVHLGLFVFPGLQNSTSVIPECDSSYDIFQVLANYVMRLLIVHGDASAVLTTAGEVAATAPDSGLLYNTFFCGAPRSSRVKHQEGMRPSLDAASYVF